MDVQMPVMDGYEATREIRNKFPSPKNATPVIALTASVIRTDLEKCKQAGMNNYVPKPFKAWQLFGAIAEATGKVKKITPKSEESPPGYQPSAISQQPVVTDLAYLSQFCEGDEEKIKKYIDMYLKAIPSFTERIEEALKTQNKMEIASQVHALKTKMLMMGMTATRDIAQQIESESRDNLDFNHIRVNLNILLEQLSVSVEELSNSKYS
jgi:CheY-like chemotaxis protein